MRTLITTGAVTLGLLMTLSASAGPPLVCHPYLTEDSYEPTSERALYAFLDNPETDSLQKLDALQRHMMAHDDRIEAILQRLDKKADANKATDMIQFLNEIALEMATYLGSSTHARSPERYKRLQELAARLKDPGCWLAVSRTVIPLMTTGTPREHARAFLAAYDQARALPEGAQRVRLLAVLNRDLDQFIRYVVDGDLRKKGIKNPKRDDRIAELRQRAVLKKKDLKKKGKQVSKKKLKKGPQSKGSK